MKLLTILSLVLSLAVAGTIAEKFSYRGYRQIRLLPQTEEHIKLILEWENNEDFDFWNEHKKINSPIDISLSPIAYHRYSVEFFANKLPFEIVTHDLQSRIDEQEMEMSRNAKARAENRIVGTFARYNDVMTWLNSMKLANPNIVKDVYSTGKTYQGRDLTVIKLGEVGTQRKIWIDCGIHAREWISPSTCIILINNFINQYNANNALAKRILAYYEIHILPIHNPDGYEYTWTTQRLWRKNRVPNAGSTCIGVDLNRNSGFQWMVAGASNNPCSDTFAGPRPNSELEIQGVQKAINASWGQWDSYLTLHTYGQWWFTPWGYTTALPVDYTHLLSKAKIGADAIKGHAGTNYVIGSGAILLGPTAGASDDWAKGIANITYSYCLELSPAQSGTDASYGFQLPESRADRVGQEVYKGITQFINSIF